MKIAVILVAFLVVVQIGFAQTETVREQVETHCCCAEFPYPGGHEAFLNYFNSHPLTIATDLSTLSVKCYMRFIVNEDGLLSNIEPVKSVPTCPECERACINLLEEMPAWIPQNYHGKPKAYMIHLPINIAFKPN